MLIVVVCSAFAPGSIADWLTRKPKTIYAFGFAASFRDTLTYITDIQVLDSAELESNSGFLHMRDLYSYQLKNYLELDLEKPNYTCMVFFNKKKKKLQKQYNKLKQEYSRSGNLNMLDSVAFHFTKPTYY